MKKNGVFLLFLIYVNVSACFLQQAQRVYIYAQNNSQGLIFKDILSNLGIRADVVDFFNKSDDDLYIVLNVNNVAQVDLPSNYITYQTTDINKNDANPGYISKLNNAIAVWDYSRTNIAQYKNQINHYHYLPHNYEFIDPIVLPCFLPKEAWSDYKGLLAYENIKNTDISSHLPTLFSLSIMQKPKRILELGVRSGESTVALGKVAQYWKAHLIGVDILPASQNPYSKISPATFLCMDDLTFPDYYAKHHSAEEKIDIIFIDTSHEYKHTLAEITKFVPLLGDDGFLAFHDSNVTPLPGSAYIRLNGTSDIAPGNPRGVTQAIKEYFDIEFDEYKYYKARFEKDGINWYIVHYPFCNGLTIIKKENRKIYDF